MSGPTDTNAVRAAATIRASAPKLGLPPRWARDRLGRAGMRWYRRLVQERADLGDPFRISDGPVVETLALQHVMVDRAADAVDAALGGCPELLADLERVLERRVKDLRTMQQGYRVVPPKVGAASVRPSDRTRQSREMPEQDEMVPPLAAFGGRAERYREA